MNVRRSRYTFVGFVVGTCLLASCGNGDDATPTASPSVSLSVPAAPAAASEATPSAAPATTPTPPEETQSPRTYVVESGDNLTSIAERLGTTVEELVAANDIEDPDIINVGSELVIP